MEARPYPMKKRCICCGWVTPHSLFYKKSNRPKKTVRSFSPTASDFGIFYNLFQCQKCDHVFAQTDSKKILQKYDQSDEGGEYFECAPFRANSMRRAFDRMARFLPRKGARVLDLGAGGGIFLDLIRELGYKGAGIEPSYSLCRKAKKKYSVSIRQGTLQRKKKNDTPFDLITLWEVIEHFARPDQEIQKIEGQLKLGGKVLIATPNVQSISAYILGSHWWSYRQMHLHYFCSRSLETLMNRFGFSKVYVNRFDKSFPFWYYLSKMIYIPLWLKKCMCFPVQIPLGDMIHLYVKRSVN